jgi:hypothetical protein
MLMRDVEIILSALANPDCCLIDTLSYLVKELVRLMPVDAPASSRTRRDVVNEP